MEYHKRTGENFTLLSRKRYGDKLFHSIHLAEEPNPA